MKLRFQVDQAECFRRGIDCPKSIVSIEVNPAEVESKLRELIAERLSGIDVCQGIVRAGKVTPYVMHSGPQYLLTNGPTWDDLVKTVHADVKRLADEEAHQEAQLATFSAEFDLKKGGRK